MAGDERVRACNRCEHDVYNLSQLTRDEAEALIVEREGRLCVAYFQRADGTILLKDCVVGVRRKRRRRLLAVGVAASLVGGALAYEEATRLEDPTRPRRESVTEPVIELHEDVVYEHDDTPDLTMLVGDVAK